MWKEINTENHNKEKYFLQTIAIKYSPGAQLNQYDNSFKVLTVMKENFSCGPEVQYTVVFAS